MFRSPSLLALMLLMQSPVHATDDPHLWLEAVEDEKALAWVREQNQESVAELTRSGDFRRIQTRVREILDSDARIPFVGKLGEHYYNFWRDAKNPRGLWRRTSLDEYRKPDPAWEIVLDLDELASAEGENWVWAGSNCLEPEYRKCLLSLSRGGADANVVREFDTVEKRFVEGGFALPEAKSGVSWIDGDTVFVGTDFGPGSMTDSGYPRIARRWQRGTPLEQAQTVYEGQAADVWIAAYSDTTPGFERQLVYRGITFYTNEVQLIRDGQLLRIDKQDSANFNLHRQWMLLELREPWTVGGRTWPAGALLVTDLEAFLAGERDFTMLFTPGERSSLAGYSPTRKHIVVNELDNVRNRLYVWSHDGRTWKRERLSGLPEFGTVSVSSVDSSNSDDFWATVNDYLTPTSLYWGQLGKTPPTVLKAMPAFFDASGLEVSQNEATSADGTRVPYFLVSKEALKLDGRNPTVLYGYGGFEVSMTPSYAASIGDAWLSKGGVYVVANIRGGGEFGPQWHQAALKANRNKAYEDFIAVAEDLIARGITTPQHLGILGGSNGGLLMGNMLTMRPDLFGAIVCQVPLLDMRRYHTLLAGASWMGEYGNPDDPAEWEFIQKYSPYHNVQAAVTYPRTLFTTSTRDDRVHPGHARKMVARMKEQGHDVLYYENIEGGHGGAANNEQRAFMTALAWTFFARELR